MRSRAVQSKLAVKAVTETTVDIEGYGVLFGGRDLQGEKFVKETDFWFKYLPADMSRPLMWDHAFDRTGPGLAPIGVVKRITQDDLGLWFEATIDRASDFGEMIHRLIEMGVVGASTGAPLHLVERSGSTIKSWPIVELSLTPTPADPRTLGGFDVKSLKFLGYGCRDSVDADTVNEETKTSATTTAATATVEVTESDLTTALQLERAKFELLEDNPDGNSSERQDRR